MKRFGEIIRAARIKKGLTLQDVANKIDGCKSYMSMLENGKSGPPRPPMVRTLAKALGIGNRMLQAIAHAQKAPEEVRKEFEWYTDKMAWTEQREPAAIS